MTKEEFDSDKFKVRLAIKNLENDIVRMEGKLDRAIERKKFGGTIDEDWALRITAAIHISKRHLRKFKSLLKIAEKESLV